MKRVAVICASLIVGIVGLASSASSTGPATILKADTLVGVSGPYVGASSPIRGINGGGLPWSIDEGRAVLGADGSWRSRSKGWY